MYFLFHEAIFSMKYRRLWKLQVIFAHQRKLQHTRTVLSTNPFKPNPFCCVFALRTSCNIDKYVS